MKIIIRHKIELYVAQNGKKPFLEWLDSLKDAKHRYRIKVRLDRIALGNFGDTKSLTEGVHELRLPFGPGYRIYFGKDGANIILLLCAGNKTSQKTDIKTALRYWKDYLSR